jgi:CRP-like cAMP-binding protein
MRRQFPVEQQPLLEDLFEGLGEGTLQTLRNAGPVQVLEEGEALEGFKGTLVRIESGLVRLAVQVPDRRFTVGLYGPGDVILGSLFQEWDTDALLIEAQEPSEVRVIPQAAVTAALRADGDLAVKLLRLSTWQQAQLMHTIGMLAFYNLNQRVSQVLINLATMFGRPHEKGGVRVGLRLTQAELAELSGARRETLNTVLQYFQEEMILNLRYARIDIKKWDELQEIANERPLPIVKRSPMLPDQYK